MDFDWPIGVVWEGYLTNPGAEPPSGGGYQLWETTTEGSPQSPVFDTLNALCAWCAANTYVFAGMRLSAQDWEKYLGDPHIQVINGKIVIG